MFFQERRVKVSLFLQDNIQNKDGGFVYSMKGPLPCCTQMPIQITYFDASDGSESGRKENHIATSLHEALKDGPRQWDMERVQDPQRRVPGLGRNLYATSASSGKTRPKSASGGGSISSSSSSSSSSAASETDNSDEGKIEDTGRFRNVLPFCAAFRPPYLTSNTSQNRSETLR